MEHLLALATLPRKFPQSGEAICVDLFWVGWLGCRKLALGSSDQ